MAQPNIINLALQSLADELAKMKAAIEAIESENRTDKLLKNVIQDGYIAQVDIHRQRSIEWVKAIQEVRGTHGADIT